MATENNKEGEGFFARFNLFDKIVKLTVKHGKITILYCVMILFLVYNIIINPIDVNRLLDKYTQKQDETHRKGMQKRQEADLVIPALLDGLRHKTQADRVALFEFHNGLSNTLDLPFYHFSATYESIDIDNDSIEEINDQYKDQTTGNYQSLFKKIKRERYIFTNDIETSPNTKLVRKMKHNGVKSYYLCAIYGDNNHLVGVLSVVSNQVDGLDETQLNRITPEITHRLANLISGIN